MNDPLDFSHFEQQAAQQTQRTNLNLRFHMEAVENKGRSLEAGRPIYDQIEMVGINVPGSKDEVVKKVNDDVKAKFGQQYTHWKRTQEQPVDGTLLSMVPWLNLAQVKEMQAINIHTLEQLASLSDTAVQKIGMGGVELRKKALAYMASAQGNADLQRLHDRIAELERENTRLKESIVQVNARYESAMQGLPMPQSNGVVPGNQAGAIDMNALAALVAAQLKGTAQ